MYKSGLMELEAVVAIARLGAVGFRPDHLLQRLRGPDRRVLITALQAPS
jgi:hypothetical protein